MNDNLNEKLRLAEDDYTTSEVMNELVRDDSPEVRIKALWNYNTPTSTKIEAAEVETNPEVLDVLFNITKNDTLTRVELTVFKKTIADNVNTSSETLNELATDMDWAVRWTVAENPSAADDTLNQLKEDENSLVSEAAAENLGSRSAEQTQKVKNQFAETKAKRQVEKAQEDPHHQ